MKWNINFKRPVKKEKSFPTGKWQAKVEHGKHRLAGWLQRQSEKLSVRTKKILLITCCMVFGSMMLLQVFNGLGFDRLPDIGKIAKPLTSLPLQKLDTVGTDSTGIENKSFNHQK